MFAGGGGRTSPLSPPSLDETLHAGSQDYSRKCTCLNLIVLLVVHALVCTLLHFHKILILVISCSKLERVKIQRRKKQQHYKWCGGKWQDTKTEWQQLNNAVIIVKSLKFESRVTDWICLIWLRECQGQSPAYSLSLYQVAHFDVQKYSLEPTWYFLFLQKA